MKKRLFLYSFLLLTLPFSALAMQNKKMQQAADTIISKGKADTSSKIENKVIEEVIEAKKPVKKEKVEYLSLVTKYGFKNLFKNYTYNSSIPYASQVNPFAETYMQDYLKSNESYLLNLRKTGLPYFNLIDGILVQYGLPKELKYLAVIESDLKSNALSIKGARGPWQFMDYTAEGYGLTVNQYQDDRTDYYKSTNAAAKYLLHLYKDLKDWLLVIAAYNGGSGRVYSAIKKSGSRNFWDLQYYLPEESRNHVKKFIATHYIMETGGDNIGDSKFNYSSLSDDDNSAVTAHLTDAEKQDIDSATVSGRYIAEVIAKNISMSIDHFNHLNPGFDKVLSEGETYNLQLPIEKMAVFNSKKIEILNESVADLLQSVNLKSR